MQIKARASRNVSSAIIGEPRNRFEAGEGGKNPYNSSNTPARFLLQHLHLTNDPLKGVDQTAVIYAGTFRELETFQLRYRHVLIPDVYIPTDTLNAQILLFFKIFQNFPFFNIVIELFLGIKYETSRIPYFRPSCSERFDRVVERFKIVFLVKFYYFLRLSKFFTSSPFLRF